jgi:hypothetical protein
MRKFALGLLLALLASPSYGAALCGAGAAQVMVVPSVHKLLNTNPRYTYTQLYELVAEFHPDLVGIEIRQEDFGRPEPYLQSNYPREMVDLFHRFRDRVFGFDWLGDELSGMPVPNDWWTKHSRIKQLERAWYASPPPSDGRMKQLTHDLEALSDRRDALESTASPEALANGAYDGITREYYRTAAALARGTPYAAVPTWYAERDRHLADNITAEIRLHPGCRMAIVTGADHHGPIMSALATLPTEAVAVKMP